ncbi:MAG: 2'-5' RNA ligase family protein [Rubritepida sp.]|nr:2'-5' RNA ligase family protein [Rubritepida sp.]
MHMALGMTRRGWMAGAASIPISRHAMAQAAGLLAIDILLEPGPAMLELAAADNARLRANYPDGFALDSAHTPHITLLQLFVAAVDLPRIQAATAAVLAAASPKDWRLTAAGRYYFPTGDLGLAGITIRPTPELLALQAAVIAAMAPFIRRGDTAGAFDGPDDPSVRTTITAYIDGFATERAGRNFNPHVSTGLGREAFVRAMVAEPFPPFAFGVAGAAIFQLGIYGTANRRLWTWAPNASPQRRG